jgi:hypothetical protein
LRELYLRTESDTELALPHFVGELRAVREQESRIPWNLLDLRPRYHVANWKHEWNNWRIKGTSPLQLGITVATPPIAKIAVADDDLEVTILGSTTSQARVKETVTMDDTEKEFTKAFTDIFSITKNILGDHNVTIEDSEENELSVIPNDVLESRYVIVDISQYPYTTTVVDSDCYIMEVLYKMKLKRMENLDDVFPVEGFDNVIILKARQLLAEGQEGKEERALLMDSKATRLIDRKTEHKEGTTTKHINFKRNGLLGMFSRRKFTR